LQSTLQTYTDCEQNTNSPAFYDDATQKNDNMKWWNDSATAAKKSWPTLLFNDAAEKICHERGAPQGLLNDERLT
jgi:hypothetical protein